MEVDVVEECRRNRSVRGEDVCSDVQRRVAQKGSLHLRRSSSSLLPLLFYSPTLRPPSFILVYTVLVHNAILDSRMIPSVMSPGFTVDAAVAF